MSRYIEGCRLPAKLPAVPVRSAALQVVAALGFASGVVAQSYADLQLVRRRPPEFASVLQAKIGIAGSIPADENVALGIESETGFDGHLYYHDERFSSEAAVLDAYVGSDGGLMSLRQDEPGGGGSRIEISGRFTPFYREGFYRAGDFIPTGRYEGSDYGAYFGFGTSAGEGMQIEGGPYFRNYSFSMNRDTDPSYILPDDFDVVGVRTYAEQNTLQMDRSRGRPLNGYILTLLIELERNNSDRTFGTPTYLSSLPSELYRARAQLEWYIPQRDLGTWTVRVAGKWSDDDDRVSAYDAQAPVGQRWVDGEIGVRFDMGGLSLTPMALGQWIKILEESGVGSAEEMFFGGGIRTRYDMSDAMSLYADYSFLDNPSRGPVSTSHDALGEHQFFAGMELRIGASRL